MPHLPICCSAAIIAPFWTDLDASHQNGVLLFRQTTDPAVLATGSTDITSYFPDHATFSATWALVVTWYKQPYYSQCNVEDPQVSILGNDTSFNQ